MNDVFTDALTDAGLRGYYNLAGHLIRRALQRSGALWTQECGAFGLTRIQFAVMTVVRYRPGLDQTRVCEMSGLDPATVVPVIARLADAGLLSRSRHPADKRRDTLTLTSKGTQLLDEMQPSVQRMDQQLLSPLTARERTVYLRLASKLVAVDNDHHQAPPGTRRRAARPQAACVPARKKREAEG